MFIIVHKSFNITFIRPYDEMGLDFKDTIVVRRSINKGTKIIEEPIKKANWTGEEFQKTEEDRLKLAGNMQIMSAKGTKKIRLADMAKTNPTFPKGYYISTGKGTGRMKID